MKLGIMGGTFDPVHNGHIFTANEVMEKLSLDKVLFIPTGNPAHKKDKKVTDAKLRYEMLQAATEGNSHFEITDMEIRRGGYTYAIDTLKDLNCLLSEETEIIYIIGADVVAELDTWKDFREDFRLCSFAAVMRPGISKESFVSAVEKMAAYGAHIIPVDISQTDVSSSEIRGMVRIGVPIKELLPDKVIEIIEREKLYRGNE